MHYTIFCPILTNIGSCRQILVIYKFTKILTVGVVLLHADKLTDRQTDKARKIM